MPVNPADQLIDDDELIRLFTRQPAIPDRSAPAFMLDENADHRCIGPIRALGLYVTTTFEQGLTGEPSDLLVLAHARRLGCALIVRDTGYERLHKRLLDLGLSHAGIIYFSFNRTPEDVVVFVESIYRQTVEKETPSILRYLYWKV